MIFRLQKEEIEPKEVTYSKLVTKYSTTKSFSDGKATCDCCCREDIFEKVEAELEGLDVVDFQFKEGYRACLASMACSFIMLSKGCLNEDVLKSISPAVSWESAIAASRFVLAASRSAMSWCATLKGPHHFSGSRGVA